MARQVKSYDDDSAADGSDNDYDRDHREKIGHRNKRMPHEHKRRHRHRRRNDEESEDDGAVHHDLDSYDDDDDDDEEEDFEEYENEMKNFIDASDEDIDDRAMYRQQEPNEKDNFDAERIQTNIDNRNYNVDLDYDSLTQQIQPRKDDPSLWISHTKKGRELDAVLELASMFISAKTKGEDFGITGAFFRSDTPGTLYLESNTRKDVEAVVYKNQKIIKGSNVGRQHRTAEVQKIQVVNKDEYLGLIQPPDKLQFYVGQKRRIKSGLHKGDIAEIRELDFNKCKAIVAVQPRFKTIEDIHTYRLTNRTYNRNRNDDSKQMNESGDASFTQYQRNSSQIMSPMGNSSLSQYSPQNSSISGLLNQAQSNPGEKNAFASRPEQKLLSDNDIIAYISRYGRNSIITLSDNKSNIDKLIQRSQIGKSISKDENDKKSNLNYLGSSTLGLNSSEATYGEIAIVTSEDSSSRLQSHSVEDIKYTKKVDDEYICVFDNGYILIQYNFNSLEKIPEYEEENAINPGYARNMSTGMMSQKDNTDVYRKSLSVGNKVFLNEHRGEANIFAALIDQYHKSGAKEIRSTLPPGVFKGVIVRTLGDQSEIRVLTEGAENDRYFNKGKAAKEEIHSYSNLSLVPYFEIQDQVGFNYGIPPMEHYGIIEAINVDEESQSLVLRVLVYGNETGPFPNKKIMNISPNDCFQVKGSEFALSQAVSGNGMEAAEEGYKIYGNQNTAASQVVGGVVGHGLLGSASRAGRPPSASGNGIMSPGWKNTNLSSVGTLVLIPNNNNIGGGMGRMIGSTGGLIRGMVVGLSSGQGGVRVLTVTNKERIVPASELRPCDNNMANSRRFNDNRYDNNDVMLSPPGSNFEKGCSVRVRCGDSTGLTGEVVEQLDEYLFIKSADLKRYQSDVANKNMSPTMSSMFNDGYICVEAAYCVRTDLGAGEHTNNPARNEMNANRNMDAGTYLRHQNEYNQDLPRKQVHSNMKVFITTGPFKGYEGVVVSVPRGSFGTNRRISVILPANLNKRIDLLETDFILADQDENMDMNDYPQGGSFYEQNRYRGYGSFGSGPAFQSDTPYSFRPGYSRANQYNQSSDMDIWG